MAALGPDDDALRHRLLAPLAAITPSTVTHPAREMLLAHAGNELDIDEATAITRHLVLCADGRCAAILRDAVAGAGIARRALADGDVVTICDHVIRISVAQCRS